MPEIDQRIAERAHFPVEDRDDPCRIVRVEHHVVELEVAVHDRRRVPDRRQRARAASRRALPFPARGAVFDRCQRSVQPADLPLDESRRLAERRESARRDVDRVQIGERVHERVAHPAPRRSDVAIAGGSSWRMTMPRRRSIA